MYMYVCYFCIFICVCVGGVTSVYLYMCVGVTSVYLYMCVGTTSVYLRVQHHYTCVRAAWLFTSKMSSLVEDPAMPLIGMTKTKQAVYHTNGPRRADSDLRSKRFATVGSRLARRKELFCKRKRLCDASLALAVTGIALMMIETELAANGVITRADATSVLLKLLVTLSTVGCLVAVGWYHVMDVQLFTINNSMEDWRLAITARRVVTVGLEILVCAVHPVPGEFYMSWMTTDSDQLMSARPTTIPVDVVLSLPMFLRLYLVLRCVMLHSRLYQDASSQSLGALNRINFNFRFIFKSMMALYPDYALSVLMLSFFLISSWTLRLCEMYNDADHARVHGNFLNSMWVVSITFLTVGYGDIVPNTLCGRGVAVVSGMMGAGCTALVVAVLARKLELSSAEKYVHDFVLEIEIGKRLKHQAANVVKHGWRLYKLNKEVSSKGESLTQVDARRLLKRQSHLLRAIYAIREIKADQRRLRDNALSMLDVYKAQLDVGGQLSSVSTRQQALEDKVTRLEGKLQMVYDMLYSIANRDKQ